MRSDFIIAVLLFIPLAILQLTIVPFMSVGGVAPDLILILLVIYTLKMGQFQGTLLGFVFGLLFDLFSGSILGSAMFAKTLSGFITGYFFNENKTENNLHTFMLMFIIFLIGSLDAMVFNFFSNTTSGTNAFILLFTQGILPGLYSSFLALPMIVFYSRKMFA